MVRIIYYFLEKYVEFKMSLTVVVGNDFEIVKAEIRRILRYGCISSDMYIKYPKNGETGKENNVPKADKAIQVLIQVPEAFQVFFPFSADLCVAIMECECISIHWDQAIFPIIYQD